MKLLISRRYRPDSELASCRLQIQRTMGKTVRFGYLRAFEDPSILQEIRLEIGALAAWTPTQQAEIHPFVANYYPHVFHQASTQVLATTSERTFWEKARIGTLKLIPASHSVERLSADYAKMLSMIYGDYPDFDELMQYINALED